MGLKEQIGDFGQTLYSWGVEDGGPYLVCDPRPTNPRDGIGHGGRQLYRSLALYLERRRHLAFHVDALRQDGIDSVSGPAQLRRSSATRSITNASLRSLFRQKPGQELDNITPKKIAPDQDFYRDPTPRNRFAPK